MSVAVDVTTEDPSQTPRTRVVSHESLSLAVIHATIKNIKDFSNVLVIVQSSNNWALMSFLYSWMGQVSL